MSAPLPIRFQELVQLPAIGVNPAIIGFATLTMESEKFICARDTTVEPAQVVIVELENLQSSSPIRFASAAEAVVMHPSQKILALKAGNQVQIYNLDYKNRLKVTQTTEPVSFWKWISTTTLALITNTAVFHWSIEGTSEPVKVFDRLPQLAGSQIINYRVDFAQKWSALVGISQKDGRVVGSIQLYSAEKKQSQVIEAHSCAFAQYLMPGAARPSNVFAFINRPAVGPGKLLIIELTSGKPEDSTGFLKKAVDVVFPPEAVGDFPVAMQVSEKYSVIYMITKLGYLYIFDLGSGLTIYLNRISTETIFVTAPQPSNGGIIGVNRRGQVLSVTIDESNIVPHICNVLGNYELALNFASKNNLAGAEDLFVGSFNKYFTEGNFKEAARVACDSPKGMLRTAQTISRFQTAPAQPNQPTPLLQYFGVLLERGKLNRLESIELGRLVLGQGRKDLFERWLNEGKLESSEELGDLLRPIDIPLSLKIYHSGEVHHKVVACLADSGQYDKIVGYCTKSNYQPDWLYLLQNIIAMNPAGAVTFSLLLLTHESGPLVDVNSVIDLFLARNLIREVTSVLLDVLKGNKPEDGVLQTRVLEINLIHAPVVANAILEQEMFTHYNRLRVAQLCEKAGLYQRALEHFTDLADFKRILANAQSISPEFLVTFFGRLSDDECLDCLRDLLRNNLRANLNMVVQIATKYSTELTPAALIELFTSFKTYEGLAFYLSSVINFSQDPEVHFRYIEACARTGNTQEVERICRESTYYEPERTRDFLKEMRLADQSPLIIVCDRFEFVEDLTHYLFKNNSMKYIEIYVQKVNPSNTPLVVGALLDAGCNEETIKSLISPVRRADIAGELVEQVEKRNRLKILLGWLEERAAEKHTDTPIYNGLAKIYIDSNKNPEQFLLNNNFYDPKVIGKYCENRDPQLAFIAYKRGNGSCDQELLEMTSKHGLFKNQARYLVERQDPELWAIALKETNNYRRNLIDQVVQTALPEVKNPNEVSTTVTAFMTANLPKELIELLEKLVLEPGTKFTGNRDLGNLLILTAIKADKSRVMDYINRLEHYDAADIATIAVGAELYEEAFVMYKRHKYNTQAVEVLIDHLHNLPRAYEFAERVNEPEVWSRLGRDYLNNGMTKDAIDSFIKASDPEYYQDVIEAAGREEIFSDLVKYLQMCRKKIKEPKIESELIYSFAKINQLADLEEFITSPNCAQIQAVGDRCFNEGMYEAAKLLYNNVSNFSRLASSLVRLSQFAAAVDAARKANNTRTWKEVNIACLDAKEYRLAQRCGLHIVIHGDELEELIDQYERRGCSEELIALLESGLGLERAHVGMFTELGVLYSKYDEKKLMPHLKEHTARLNIPKLLRITTKNHQWKELTFLYIFYDEHDNAVQTMISHPVAWDHSLFKDVIIKVANTEILYKSVSFYLDEHPTLIVELLKAVTSRIDSIRLVSLVGKRNHLPLIRPYLLSIQDQDITAVNEALHQLYIEEGDHEQLRTSIDTFQNFDSLSLAKQLETHDLLEFRRIAAYLYQKNGHWAQSVRLSKQDKLYRDAITTTAKSQQREVATELLEFFVEQGNKECFAACLYSCYSLLQADFVLELAWRNGMTDFAMPFFIQVTRDLHSKVDQLSEAVATLTTQAASKPTEDTSQAVQSQPSPSSQTLQAQSFPNSGPVADQTPAYYLPNPVQPMGMGMMGMGLGRSVGPAGFGSGGLSTAGGLGTGGLATGTISQGAYGQANSFDAFGF